jgi:hypothetical protein
LSCASWRDSLWKSITKCHFEQVRRLSKMYINVTLRLDCGSIVRFMNTCYILVVKVIFNLWRGLLEYNGDCPCKDVFYLIFSCQLILFVVVGKINFMLFLGCTHSNTNRLNLNCRNVYKCHITTRLWQYCSFYEYLLHFSCESHHVWCPCPLDIILKLKGYRRIMV